LRPATPLVSGKAGILRGSGVTRASECITTSTYNHHCLSLPAADQQSQASSCLLSPEISRTFLSLPIPHVRYVLPNASTSAAGNTLNASPHVRKAGRLKGGQGRFLSGRIDKHRLTGSEEDHRYPETHWRRSSLMIRYIAGLEPTESDNASLLPVPREQETGDCDGVMACSMHPQVGPYLVQGCESATRNDLCAWSGV